MKATMVGWLGMLGLLLVLASPDTARAAQSYDNCTGFITSLPAVIAAPGTWCLKSDLNTAIASGDAITINTNNVTLDCNDFKLGGLAAGQGTGTNGIRAASRQNLTIRHCNIRGFLRGLFLTIGGNLLIEDNRLDSNTFMGIYAEGDGSVIRRNRVADTGQGVGAYAYAIFATGSTDVLDNIVANVVGPTGGNGNVYGLYLSSNSHGSVTGNRIRNVVPDGTGQGWGIYTPTSDRLSVNDNQIVGNGAGSNVTGLLCAGTTDRARNNTFNGLATAMSNCGDAGGNDITP